MLRPSTPRPRCGRCAQGARDARRGERGAALLVVITSVAILTAVTVDLAYNTRVSLQAAANARDELRAYYLAKSGVAMSRLVLSFQQRLDGATSGVAAAAGAAGGAGGAAGGLAAALGGGAMKLRLWDLIPVDSSATSLFVGAGEAGPPPSLFERAVAKEGAAPPETGTRRAFGDAEGSFHATIADEERKINIAQFDALPATGLPTAQSARFTDLMKDPKWDFLFDEDDANGMRVQRRELIAALKDWEDENEMSSNYTGVLTKPFEDGFGDENGYYDRLTDRYKAKNAPYDSLDELYMVVGVSDAFMAAFGDKLTIYPDKNATINVNTDDPAQLMVNALLMSDPPGVPQPALVDPAFLQKLRMALALAKPLPFMSITPQQFASVLSGLGVKVQQLFQQNINRDLRSPFGDQSKTFEIRAVGVAGDITKRIAAVVTFDNRAEGLSQDAGRLLHWHEE